MLALCELRLTRCIESQLLSLFIRHIAADDSSILYLSGSVYTDSYHYFSFLLEVIGRLRQSTFDSSSGKAP